MCCRRRFGGLPVPCLFCAREAARAHSVRAPCPFTSDKNVERRVDPMGLRRSLMRLPVWVDVRRCTYPQFNVPVCVAHAVSVGQRGDLHHEKKMQQWGWKLNGISPSALYTQYSAVQIFLFL